MERDDDAFYKSRLQEEYDKVEDQVVDLESFVPTIDSLFADFHLKFNEFMKHHWCSDLRTLSQSGKIMLDYLVEDKNLADELNRDQFFGKIRNIQKNLEETRETYRGYEGDNESGHRAVLELRLNEMEERSARIHTKLKIFEQIAETSFLEDLEAYANQLYCNTSQLFGASAKAEVLLVLHRVIFAPSLASFTTHVCNQMILEIKRLEKIFLHFTFAQETMKDEETTKEAFSFAAESGNVLSQLSLVVVDYQEINWYLCDEKRFKQDCLLNIELAEQRVDEVRKLIFDCLFVLFK